MENYFQNIFPKISGSQEDNQISILVVLTHFLVVEDTRTSEFCYPAKSLLHNTLLYLPKGKKLSLKET